jgi:hypothetical protein
MVISDKMYEVTDQYLESFVEQNKGEPIELCLKKIRREVHPLLHGYCLMWLMANGNMPAGQRGS